jgi:Zinc finger, C3HC4 type (RING finger)
MDTAARAFQHGMNSVGETLRQTTDAASGMFDTFFSDNDHDMGGVPTSTNTSRRSTRTDYSDRGSETFERQRRPYAGSPEPVIEIPRPSPRFRTTSHSSAPPEIDNLHLHDPVEPAPFERQRRQYTSAHLPTPDPRPPRQPVSAPSSPPPDLRDLVEKGVDISTLPTSTLLTIMRNNNCPLPPGALEKDDLIERVEEMASFVLPTPNEKLQKVRNDDEDDCKICFERVADYCLVPCGHTGFCFMCARKMGECPFCKKEVGHAQKLWKV